MYIEMSRNTPNPEGMCIACHAGYTRAYVQRMRYEYGRVSAVACICVMPTEYIGEHYEGACVRQGIHVATHINKTHALVEYSTACRKH
jgi:hypothetical protein